MAVARASRVASRSIAPSAMARHLLVTNDFPPKVGGIQSYLWELWRRLPADEVTVLTTPHEGAPAWDAGERYRIERAEQRVLLPTRALAAHIDALAAEVGAELVLLDPALPVGHLGPHLERPYGLVLHGAEITMPGRTWPGRPLLRRTLRGARLVIAAGDYPAAEARRAAGCELPTVVVPPGVDVERFRPLDPAERDVARAELGVAPDALLVTSVSRLVPRKGMDVLIEAAHRLAPRHPDLVVAIAGDGRDRDRLARLGAGGPADVRLLGRVPDAALPGLYGAADVFAMLCRNRWLGLEQEGFGIVFLEAAASGVPQVAGRSGGAGDAVEHGITGLVVDPPRDPAVVADALGSLLDDGARRRSMGAAARRRAVDELAYDALAARLAAAIDAAVR